MATVHIPKISSTTVLETKLDSRTELDTSTLCFSCLGYDWIGWVSFIGRNQSGCKSLRNQHGIPWVLARFWTTVPRVSSNGWYPVKNPFPMLPRVSFPKAQVAVLAATSFITLPSSNSFFCGNLSWVNLLLTSTLWGRLGAFAAGHCLLFVHLR